MSLAWCLIFFITQSVLARDISLEDLKNAKPGHLELDPNLRHHFPVEFFEPSSESRIAGGWESEPYSRPYQAAIYTPVNTGLSFCGGSLISSRTILTAAHCVDLATDELIIFLGAHVMPPTGLDGALDLMSSQYVIHPDWSRATLLNDIALIYLPQAVLLGERVNIIPLPSDNTNDYLRNETLVSGWGLPGDGSTNVSPVLREVTSHIISNVACRLAYMTTVQRTHICMSGAERGSTCRGDSGGPVIANGVQVGVVSFGSSLGCEFGWPPVFTRVTSYLDWINQNIITTS